MKSADFALILIESILHRTKNSFFEEKRKSHNCKKKEFVAGFKDSYDQLDELLNAESTMHYLDGSLGSSFLDFGTVGTRNDNEIYFVIEVDGNSRSLTVNKTHLPYLLKSLEEYFKYITEKEKTIKKTDKPNVVLDNLPDHSELRKALSKYIEEISDFDFNHVINCHSLLPKRIDKFLWIGEDKGEAHRFTTKFGMKLSKWNKCFYFKDRKPLHAHNKSLKDLDIDVILDLDSNQ